MSPHEIEVGTNVRERFDGSSVTCRYEVDVRLPADAKGAAAVEAYKTLRDVARGVALERLSRLLEPGGGAE